MTDKEKKAIKEAVKDFLRVELLAVVPVVIVALQAPDVTVKVIVLQTVVAALKGLEKYLHKSDKRALPF